MSTPSDPSAEWSVELLYRPLRCGDGEEHVVLRHRLRRLELEGVLDEVTVRRMGRELDLSGAVDADGHSDEVRRRVVEFLGWARRNRVSVPGLRRKDAVGVGRMGPSHAAVELPATLLGVYRDGELVWVLPGEADGTTYTVTDWLDAVADRDRPVAGGEPLETVA